MGLTNPISYLSDIACRYRYVIVGIFSAGVAIFDSFDKASLQDPFIFAAAGLRLFSHSWLNVFGDSQIQVGPLQLIYSGIIAAISKTTGIGLRLPLSLVTQVLFAIGAMLVTRALLRSDDKRSAGAEFATGCIVAIFSIGYRSFTSGQPSDGFIAAIWVLSAIAARKGHGWIAGALIGASVALKPWGALGFPLLLLAPNLKDVIDGALVMTVISAVAYLPFILFGDFKMFTFRWLFEPHSPLRYLYGSSIGFTWQDRMIQGAIVSVVGVIATLKARRSGIAAWAAPLAIVATKVTLDPVRWYWYWIPIQLLCLWGTTMIATRRQEIPWVLAPIAAMALVVVLPSGGLLLGLLVIAVVMALLFTPLTGSLGAIHAQGALRGSYSQATVRTPEVAMAKGRDKPKKETKKPKKDKK
ncbi:MAG: glycosyltransferase 87 family protein [Actinomycetota bacterium]